MKQFFINDTQHPGSYINFSKSHISEYIFVILKKIKISIENSFEHSTIHAMSKHCATFYQILSSHFWVHGKFAIPNKKKYVAKYLS